MGSSKLTKSVLDRVSKLTTWKVAIIFAVVGLAVFFTGLTNPFIGDDDLQIVKNIPVHSISNILLFFQGSTFYSGQAYKPLFGVYYRPLSTTAFSLIYILFGPQPITFHVFMLIVYIANAFLLFLFLRHSFKPVIALLLSLVFLVHPLNSQTVFAIFSMQDVLFFFFGMLAMLVLLRYSSVRSLFLVAICLLLSLLSKEAGLLFVAMAIIYLFLFDRKRLLPLVYIILMPITIYLALKTNAVGLSSNPHNAPIDELNLAGRLLTAPSIMLFYIAKSLFPLQLASGYYWVYPNFSFLHVLLPLLIDVIVIVPFVYLGFVIRKRASKAMFFTYLFFASWTGIGLLLYLQCIPLDLTASENWIYFPMVGVLGLIGLVFDVFQERIQPSWILAAAMIVIAAFGIRTAVRGFDWKSQYSLAISDITSSKEDYVAYDNAAATLIDHGNYKTAEIYAAQSVSIYPNVEGYNSLGLAERDSGDYQNAIKTFIAGLKFRSDSKLYESLGAVTLVYGDLASDRALLLTAIDKQPHDSRLWLYLAILEQRNNNNDFARIAISKAAIYGDVPSFIYDGIMNNAPFTIDLDTGESVSVP